MEKILLVNPIGSRRKKRAPVKSRRKNPTSKRSAATMAKRKARRTAAQKAATRRLVALNRSGRKSPARKRRRNPLSARAAAYRAVPSANPIRRRKRRTVAAVSRRRVTRRRNPIGGRGIVNQLLIPALTATSGALVLDLAMGYLPIPAAIKAGPLRHVVKGAGAVAIGLIGAKVVKKSTADAMALGALTVVLHDAAKEAIAKFAPAVKLGDVGLYVNGLGYYSPATPAGTYEALPHGVAGLGMYTDGYSGAGIETEAGYVYN